MSFLPLCERAARAGGEVLLAYRDRFTAREKGPRDLVSEADLAAQQCIYGVIQAEFPNHDFLGEEDDHAAPRKSQSDYRWVVDPLDGTTNYVHGLPNYAVSIALEHQGELMCGVVLDPVMNECFSAERGGGAKLNGCSFATSRCKLPERALAAASFAPQVPRGSIEITRFLEGLHACQGVRRLGSAALNLAYVACGRLDVYWASSVKIWDVAAGILLVREAGGIVTGIQGGAFDRMRPELLASASPELHAAMLEILPR